MEGENCKAILPCNEQMKGATMDSKRLKSILPTKERMKKRLIIPMWLLGYFVFLIVGGFIITVIEESNDISIKNERRKYLLKVLEKYGKLPNDTMALEIIQAAVKVYSVKALNLADLTAEVASGWGFSGGLFFCATLVTTIGYGDRYPITTGGRWFTIIFALVGIPFTGFLLAKIGSELTDLIKKLDSTVKKSVKRIVGNKVAVEEKLKFYVRMFQILVVVGIFILMFWIIPAIIFVYTEDWDYITAIYYCFITISTIGLGDVIPGTSTTNVEINGDFSMANFQAAAVQASTLIYFILGLSALTIILSLVKSIMNIVAVSAKSQAENFSSKGMKLFGNVSSSVRHRITGTAALENGENNDLPSGKEEGKKLSGIPEEYHVDEPGSQAFGSGFWDQIQEEEPNESILNLGFEDETEDGKKEGETNNENISTSPQMDEKIDRRGSRGSRSNLIMEEKDTTNLPSIE